MTEASPTATAAPDLSIVIPVYDEPDQIPPTLAAAAAAVERSSFTAEAIVVDDGSPDANGAAAARAGDAGLAVRAVVFDDNVGRFRARLAGAEAAAGEFLLFLDAGVLLDERSLSFVADQLKLHPERRVWNPHVLMDTHGKPIAQFWDVVTTVAWWDYHREPRTTSFGAEDFDRYPKGTTAFFAPRDVLVDAYRRARSVYEPDLVHASSDTLPLRLIAERERIWISPEFACHYWPTGSLRGFVRHAFYRGIHFLDSFADRRSRFFPAVIAYYPSSALLAVAAARRPRVVPAVLAAVGAVAGVVAASYRRRPAEIASVSALAPLFVVAHGAGMWRGLLMAAAAAARRRR